MRNTLPRLLVLRFTGADFAPAVATANAVVAADELHL